MRYRYDFRHARVGMAAIRRTNDEIVTPRLVLLYHFADSAHSCRRAGRWRRRRRYSC